MRIMNMWRSSGCSKEDGKHLSSYDKELVGKLTLSSLRMQPAMQPSLLSTGYFPSFLETTKGKVYRRRQSSNSLRGRQLCCNASTGRGKAPFQPARSQNTAIRALGSCWSSFPRSVRMLGDEFYSIRQEGSVCDSLCLCNML